MHGDVIFKLGGKVVSVTSRVSIYITKSRAANDFKR